MKKFIRFLTLIFLVFSQPLVSIYPYIYYENINLKNEVKCFEFRVCDNLIKIVYINLFETFKKIIDLSYSLATLPYNKNSNKNTTNKSFDFIFISYFYFQDIKTDKNLNIQEFLFKNLNFKIFIFHLKVYFLFLFLFFYHKYKFNFYYLKPRSAIDDLILFSFLGIFKYPNYICGVLNLKPPKYN